MHHGTVDEGAPVAVATIVPAWRRGTFGKTSIDAMPGPSASHRDAVLAAANGKPTPLYGAGLRLMEASRLRAKAIDLEPGRLTIREAKGNNDRVPGLPDCLRGSLGELLHRGRRIQAVDVEKGGVG